MSSKPTFEAPKLKNNYKVAMVATYWNEDLCASLLADAKKQLENYKQHIKYDIYKVAGCIELGHAAARLLKNYDAVIIFGVVIRGETSHFDYVCQSITQTTSQILAKGEKPVIFGVLTVENKQQALDRIHGPKEYKGQDCVESLVQQLHFIESIN